MEEEKTPQELEEESFQKEMTDLSEKLEIKPKTIEEAYDHLLLRLQQIYKGGLDKVGKGYYDHKSYRDLLYEILFLHGDYEDLKKNMKIEK